MSRHAYLAAAALVAAAGVSIGLAGMSAATDSGAVAPTLASVKTSAPASFVPIDEEKAGLEMAQAQSRFLPVFDRAARTAGFGGAYFNGATPHLNVASGVDEEALLSPLAEFASSDTVRVHKVRWTYAELQGAAREMGDRGGDREEPFAIRQAQLDVRRNRVVLLVDGDLDAARSLVSAASAVPAMFRLSRGPATVCPSSMATTTARTRRFSRQNRRRSTTLRRDQERTVAPHVTPSRSRHPFAFTSHALAGDVSGKG